MNALLMYSDYDHLQGHGQLSHTPCDVKFHLYIPIDSTIPYAVFTSHGKHKHPPPESSKTPTKIWQEISQLIG